MKRISLIGLIVLLTVIATTVFGQRHLEILDSLEGNFSEVVEVIEREYAEGRISKRQLKQYMRWKISTEPYITSNGLIKKDGSTLLRAFEEYHSAHKTGVRNQRVANGHWSSAIPSDFSPSYPANGRINCIAVHPTNPSIIYVGTPIGGIWKTTNNGGSWTCLTDGLPFNSIASIQLHPNNPNHVYALTGDGDGAQMYSMGIIESVDGGLTWDRTPLQWGPEDQQRGYDLLIDYNSPDKMFVCTNQGLYATTDGWTTVIPYLTGAPLFDIAFAPGGTNTLYASSNRLLYRFDSIGNNMLGFNLSNGADGSVGLPEPSEISTDRTAIAVSPDEPDWVYVLFAENVDGNGFKGLYLSENRGDSFALQSISPNIVGSDDYNQVSYDLELAVDPLDANTVFVGGIQLWRSENKGIQSTWTQVANGTGLPSVHADIHELLFLPGALFIGSDGGISKTTNDGASFTNMTDGLNIMQFYDFDVKIDIDNDPITIGGGTQDNGSNQWDYGDIQADHILGGDGFELMYDPSDYFTMYACTQERRYRSYNAGASWTNITPPGDSSSWDASWIMHPADYDTMYCAWEDISRTYNRGNTWVSLNAGFNQSIRAMAQGVNDPNRFYASDRHSVKTTSNIHSSTSVIWLNIHGNLPALGDSLFVGGLCVDPTNSNEVWVTMLNYQDGVKVFYSSNNGVNWTNISGTLPNVPIHCITYNPGSNNGVYVGTDIGIFYRDATMSDWQYFGNGLPNTQVSDMKVFEGHLYAATYGRGVWRSPLWTPCPSENMLTQANDPSSPSFTGIQHYNASSALVSTRIITGGVGTDVKYRAGNSVSLKPGFEVRPNNLFEAKIGGCLD